MSTAEKFTFGEDFGRGRSAPLTVSPAEKARIENESRARAAGYSEGVAAGRTQAQAELDQRLAQAMEAVATRAADLLARFDRLEDMAADEAVAFALKFADAAAGAALRRFPLAALEAAARETFGQVRQAPHCVVRLEESLVEQANETLARIARERGFDGRLVVMGEADMKPADFSLEWADGGVRRDGDSLRSKLADAIERHAAIATSSL